MPIGYLINLANGSKTAPAYPQTLYKGRVYHITGVEVVDKFAPRQAPGYTRGRSILGPQRGYSISVTTARDLDSGAGAGLGPRCRGSGRIVPDTLTEAITARADLYRARASKAKNEAGGRRVLDAWRLEWRAEDYTEAAEALERAAEAVGRVETMEPGRIVGRAYMAVYGGRVRA